MTVEISVVFAIIAVALYFFASQKLPLYVTSLGIMVLVICVPFIGELPWLRDTGLDFAGSFPTVEEGLSGLSNPATVTVMAMFLLSAGIQRSGLMHVLGRKIVPLVGDSEVRFLLVVTGLVGVISGFVNNTAAVAVAIPFVIELSRRIGLKASKALIPLSFLGMLGGMLTVIGTSTSILAVAILADLPQFGRPLGMFEFAPVGLLILVIGLLYFVTVGRHLLPNRDLGGGETDEDAQFVVELRIPHGSELVGNTLADADNVNYIGADILGLTRGDTRHDSEPAATMPLEDGDIVTVHATTRQVADFVASDHVHVASDMDGNYGHAREGHLVRAVVRNRWLFNGRRSADIGFWRRYRARPIGLEGSGTQDTRLADTKLRVGEIVLLEAAEKDLPQLRSRPDLVLLSEFEDEFDRSRMWLVGSIMLAVVLSAALTPLPIVVTALAGVVLMAVSRCITAEDLTSGVQWEIIFMLAGVIPLGIAMTKSGGAQWIGEVLASAATGWHPLLVLMALYVVTTVLTEVVSNNASVVILVPVGVALSTALDIPVLAVALTVMFAASTSFLSPVGYQTNAMVFGTGVYKFTDFAKVGAPLNLILMVATCTAIWWMWG
ncbi:SLC13 family permease [Zhihengliuella salsuginis]|uniref:SLC13 family permease n=1 Tax=Zhihengliuella salsuginis TaxID=578222 RepID=A0ABQ3G9W0_9MICC|nr:SLC13 family permease [Zhihengliuella salsuginis]GHC99215.1 SLC13 family permease [Zhihengliuella salsuginis]